MFFSLLDAFEKLTVLPLGTRSGKKVGVLYWAGYPLVGLLFGILGMFLVRFVYDDASMLVVWILPFIWLFLSGGKHFIALCRSCNGMLFQGSSLERVKAIGISGTAIPGLALAVAFFMGKYLALMQAKSLPTEILQYSVFYIPIVSRYLILILGLIASDSINWVSTDKVRPREFGLATLLVLLLGYFQYILFCLTLSFGFVMLLLFISIGVLRFSLIPKEQIVASVEVVETALLWFVSITGSFGYWGLFIN